MAQEEGAGCSVAMDPAYALPRNGIKAEPTPMEILDLLSQNLADLCTRFFNL